MIHTYAARTDGAMDHARTRNSNFMWCANTFAFISQTRNFYEFEFEWENPEENRICGRSGPDGRAEGNVGFAEGNVDFAEGVPLSTNAMAHDIHRTQFVLQQHFMINSLCAACVCICVHAIESHITALAETNK